MRRVKVILSVWMVFVFGCYSLALAEENQAPKEEIVQEKSVEGTTKLGQQSFSAATVSTEVSPEVQQLYSTTHQVNVDPHTGSSSAAIPIALPPGRNGIQPNVTAVYNSSARNGVMGVGWAMEFGSIQRSTKDGVPSYTNGDTFILSQAGSVQELVYDSSSGYYRPEIEGGFMKIEYLSSSSPAHWVVTDKTGTKYFFGEFQAAQEYDPSSVTKIYRWLLNRVEDIHGNNMTFTYARDGAVLYPEKIEYTGHTDGTSPHAYVSFILENRPDKRDKFNSGFKMSVNKRVAAIEVYAQNQLQRKYEFVYTTSTMSMCSLLTSVRQIAADGISTLPITTYEYEDTSANSFDTTSNWIVPVLGGGIGFTEQNGSSDSGLRLADVNGDALIDLLWADGDLTSNPHRTFLNTGSGFQETSDWIVPEEASFLEAGGDNGVRLADINGDGLADLLWFDNDDSNQRKTFLNSGNGFSEISSWLMPEGLSFTEDGNGDNGVRLVDINGDGYTDILQADRTDSMTQHRTFLNNKTNGFVEVNQWIVPQQLGFTDSSDGSSDNGVRLVDLNGDGLIDLIWADGTDTSQRGAYLNNGQDFVQTSNWILPASLGFTEALDGNSDNGVRMVDLNGDGLIDIIQADGTNMSEHRAFLNDGTNFVLTSSWVLPADMGFSESDGDTDNGIRLADVDGDGKVDILQADGGNGSEHRAVVNTADDFDLLKRIDNGTGGVTEIEYETSSNSNHTFLPFHVPVVKSITVNNNLGEQYTTEYEYQDGLWNTQKREFRGFGYIKVMDPEGNYSDTRYYQDDLLKGRPMEQRSFDAAGNLYSKSINTWDHDNICPGVDFVFLKRTDQWVCNGDATCFRTASESEYSETPQMGNVTLTRNLGEVDANTGADIKEDSQSMTYEYVENMTGGNYLNGFPKTTKVFDHAGVQMREVQFTYDGGVVGSLPVKGVLTRKEAMKSVGPGLATNYEYDTYGNLTKTIDPNTNTTEITYDSECHIFPLEAENAATHTVKNEYYGINGVALDDGNGFQGFFGQVKSTTDPNEVKGQRTYDEFGRMTAAVSPLDSLSFPTAETEFQLGSPVTWVKTKQRIEHGQGQTIDAYQFYDGLGRQIQTKTPSAVSGQTIVSGQVEYNSRGLPEKQYLPYFSSNTLTVPDAINPSRPHTLIEYDAMGRMVKTTHPDGAYITISYDDTITTMIDENGHMQKSYVDAYGRLVKKEEYTGADGRFLNVYPATTGPVDTHYTLYATTEYIYDALGNLTQTIDDHGNTTTITYNELGQKIAMNDPDMGVWTYEYDDNGNLKKQTDAKGQVIHFIYDELNRLKRKYDDNNTLDVTYTYDEVGQAYAKGRLNKAEYEDGEAAFEYDAIGRETRSTKMIGTTARDVLRGYDALNNITDVTYPSGESIYYQYNPAGQIKAIGTDPALFEQQSFLRNMCDPWSVACNPGLTTENRSQITFNKEKDSFWHELWDVVNIFGTPEAEAQITIDYNSMTDNDPGNALTHTSSCVTFTNVESRNSKSYYYKAYTTSGDFVYHVDTMISDAGVSGETAIWGITNTPDSAHEGSPEWSDGILVGWYTIGSTVRLEIDEKPSGVDNSVNLAKNQPYYLTISRTGNTLTVEIYDNSSRSGTPVDTLTEVFSADAYAYLYGFATEDGGFDGYQVSGNACNLVDVSGSGGGDMESPSVPQNLSATVVSSSQINLDWDDSTDNVGVTGYRIFRDGSELTTTTQSDYSDTGLSASTTYSYQVEAYDAASNTSAKSTSAQATTQSSGGPNQAPVLASIGNKNVNENQLLQFTISATDPDNDPLTYSASNLPSGASFNPSTRTFSWTPDYDDAGSYNTLMFTASDGSLQDSEIITITVNDVNRAPVLDAIGNKTVTEGQALSFTVTGSDPDNDSTTFGIVDAPAGSSFDMNTGAFSWTPASVTTQNVTFSITDGSLSDSEQISIQVNAASGGGTVVEVQVQGDYEDAEETGSGGIFGTSVDLKMGRYLTGMIFKNLNIPQGAEITNAYIQFKAEASDSGTTNLTIYAQDDATPEQFSLALHDISDRPLTNASVSWNPPAWSSGDSGIDQRTPNISTVISEVIALGNWQAGNDLVIIVDGTGEREAESYDGDPEGAATLHVEYTTGFSEPQLFVTDVIYTPSGQIERIEYGNGVVATYGYDARLRPVEVITFNATGNLQHFEYIYDGVGNIVEIIDHEHTGSQTFAYDALNRLVEATGQYNNGVTQTKTYLYDSIGNIEEKDGLTYTYGENGGACPSGPCGGGPHAVTSLSDGSTFAYDDNGNMTAMNRGGVSTGYVYDAENRLVEVQKNSQTVSEYAYDGDGGRTKKTVYPNAVEGGNTCFLAGTQVVMADGTTKAIEDIRIGDTVLSFDEMSGEKVSSKVTHFFDGEYTNEYLLLNNGLGVTENHLFYSEGEWRQIGKLVLDSKLLDLELADTDIKSVQKVHTPNKVRVYNIEVDQHHNYFVTEEPIFEKSDQLSVISDQGSNQQITGYLVHNKIDYGSSSSSTPIVTTFIGSLYEESNGVATEHVFLGGQRIASIRNGEVLYFHTDHLGGTNVISDSDGELKELTEYKPFGQISRYEKYGSDIETTSFYFTGQRLDEESGLMYYGARYYDPSIGRFITADSIVQAPNNPQTLNRYAYTSNNPVNRIDSSGHFWGAAFGLSKGASAVWGTTTDSGQQFFQDWAGLFGFTGGLVNGINGDWSLFQSQVISAGTGYIFGGGPFGAVSSMATTSALSTKAGRGATDWVADEIYDDILGFSPRTAYMLAYIDLTITGTYLSERAVANILGDPVQIRNAQLTDVEIAELRKNGQFIGDENMFGPSLKTKGAFDRNNVKGLTRDGKLVGSFQKRPLDVPGLKQLGAQHSSVNTLTVASSSVSELNPWKYATWGVCHQASNASLLNGGISSNILNLGPSWDMFVTTAAYGNYGGMLSNRIYSGFNANENYKKGY
ncbi:MAG: VCBS repeat-containing protein [Candidatus Omnitrophica bacterium]|nr:VCBS repeat-containing protein [Candidatus Omnitrophota bacterium]